MILLLISCNIKLTKTEEYCNVNSQDTVQLLQA